MPDPRVTAHFDQGEQECRKDLAILSEVWRRLSGQVGDVQAICDMTAMLAKRDRRDLAMCLAFAAREAARNAP